MWTVGKKLAKLEVITANTITKPVLWDVTL